MKSIEKILLALIFLFILSGCDSVSEPKLIEDRTQIQQKREKGILPTDHMVNKLTMQIGKYSLKDLDEYYRNTLPEEKENDYYNNARKMLIWSMVESYGLVENGENKLITYYLNETSSLKFMDPNIVLKMLVSAEEFMDKNELKSTASKIYDLNKKAISALDDPAPYMAKMGQKWEEIRLFSESKTNAGL